MNAKELRQAAELLKQSDENRRRQFKRMGTEVVQGVEGLVADHIIATVREDDDETYTADWGREAMGRSELVFNRHFTLALYPTPTIETDVPGQSIGFLDTTVKTRGDFRTLCRLLGVKLRDSTSIPKDTK